MNDKIDNNVRGRLLPREGYPESLTSDLFLGNVLIFSVHTGDEGRGCFSVLQAYKENRKKLKIIHVGEALSVGNCLSESSEVLTENADSYQIAVWGLKKYNLIYGEFLVRRLMEEIGKEECISLFVPSLAESDQPRRAIALAAMEAARRTNGKYQVIQYEIEEPLVANLWLDITDIQDSKRGFLEEIDKLTDSKYSAEAVLALNRFRSFGFSPDIGAVEAYSVNQSIPWIHDPHISSQIRNWSGVPKGLECEGPLVSVIVRSMDRAVLPEALDSVARQTWPLIELLVVAANGSAHRPLPAWWGRYPLRFLSSDEPLPRSQAANMGLKHAVGDLFIFLDDDDLFLPDHVASLVDALKNNPEVRAAYSGVRVDSYQSDETTPDESFNFNESYNLDKLRGRNFIPIHAVLFNRSLVSQNGCRFDERFDLFEDWDFWLQVAQHTEFHHLDSVSAIYRNHGDSGLGLGSGDKNKALRLNQAIGMVFEKWKIKWSGEVWAEIVEYRESLCKSATNYVNGISSELARIGKQSEDRAAAIDYLKEQLGHSEGRAQFLEKQSEDRAGVITHLEAQLANSHERQQRIEDLEAQLANSHERQQRIEDLESSLAYESWLLADARHREEELKRAIAELANSTSWRLTKPVRLISRLVRGDFRSAATSVRRNLGFEVGDRADKKTEQVVFQTHCVSESENEIPVDAWHGELIDLQLVGPLSERPPGRIAIQVHAFYADLVEELSDYLSKFPWPFDLYVSAASREAILECRRHFGRLDRIQKLTIREVPNKGRDIAPLFCHFKDAMLSYDYIAHIHTKKSLYNDGATQGWREYLLESLFGSSEKIGRIFRVLTSDDGIGLIFPQSFSGLPYVANTWLSNAGLGRDLCQRLGIEHYSTGYQAYPTGSMFWARVDALKPLFQLGLQLDDFPEEMGQTDGTLAHCLERMLPLSAKSAGFSSAILRDEKTPSWSPCRLDQYLWGGHENFEELLTEPSIRLIVFDVFDTLLIRPLLSPESIKRLIARKLGGNLGEVFLAHRAAAEAEARQIAQRDVGLDEIYRRFRELSGLTDEEVTHIRGQEETMELAAVSRRPETAGLLELASAHGKHVVLASDMYLPREVLERMLLDSGIRGWKRLYLSSEVGLRKDSGGLYRYILEEESVQPDQVLVVGDNEQSDVQVPWHLGMTTRHVMRPVELARALPRLKPLVDDTLQKNQLSAEITLGLIVQANFQRVTYRHFEPDAFTHGTPWSIGYSVLGPLTLAFSQWLHARAQQDGISRLYFLAREGQFLKTVYDRYAKSKTSGRESHYLVVSRRCVSVAAIEDMEDILSIASRRYHMGKVSDFLRERFGIELNESELKKIWPGQEKGLSLEVNEDGEVDHILPLLEALKPKIFTQAQKERVGLIAYLNEMGIYDDPVSAVVDIGYSATIQDYLNRVCLAPIHGYYIATSERSAEVANRHQVHVEGCFAHQTGSVTAGPPILSRSFDLERMLSADQAQVVAYARTPEGMLHPRFNALGELEQQSRPTREMLQRGALAFVDAALSAQSKLLDDLIISPALAGELYARFIQSHSWRESQSLKPLVLDDHYCGRGVVN